MPWTDKQRRYLLSDASPLTGAQKAKMKRELHADPAMGHAKKLETESHSYSWRSHQGQPKRNK